MSKRFETFRDFYPYYLDEHRDRTCRRLHFVGTALVIVTALVALTTSHYSLLWLLPLPGYGFARVPLKVKASWGNMVETYLRKRSNLKAVVVVLDIRRDLSDGDMDLLNWLSKYRITSIPVLTKSDKLSRQKIMARVRQIGKELDKLSPSSPTIFSAKTREGKARIWEKILRSIE